VFLDGSAQKKPLPQCRLIAALTCALVFPSGLSAQVPGELRGRITDAESGRPINGARVEVVGRAQFVFSQADGSYALRGLEPGDVAIRVRAISYAPRDTTVVAANGRAAIADFALQLAASHLDPIVVRARRDSATAVVLNRIAIEQSGRRDVGELLQAVPGVVVTHAGGPGAPSHVSIRGSSANEVLVLVDGNPINSPITGDADLSRIGIESIERITVLPGAQSARYGGRALAGVVAIETRRAAHEHAASATVGAWGERNASVSLGQRADLASVTGTASLIGDYRETRGDFSYDVPLLRGGGTARRVNADTRSLGLIAAASLERDNASLQLHAESDSRTRGMPGSIVQPSVTGRQHELRVAGGADARWTSGRVSSTMNVDVAHERESFADPNPPFGSVYNDTIRATTATLSGTSSIVVRAVTSTLGVEGRVLDVASTMLAPGSPHVQRQLGAWTSNRIVRSTSTGYDLSADLSARLDWDSLLRGAVASPRVGLTAARGAASLAAFFGAGYAPPSLADQFFHEGVLVRPNPSLQPERVRNEAEVRATVRAVRVGALDFDGEAAAFRANIDGMILWQPDFRFVWSPSNFDVTRKGGEASARVGVPALGVEARGSVSVADVRYVGSALSGQVAYRPRTTANTSAALTRLGVRVEVTTRYIGSRRTVTASEINALEPYSLTDLRVSRSFNHRAVRIDASVGVENLLDRSASMLVDYPFPGRSWSVSLRTRW
jgi:outer membrane cobalamin receptor